MRSISPESPQFVLALASQVLDGATKEIALPLIKIPV
jgi:hypothetical protein